MKKSFLAILATVFLSLNVYASEHMEHDHSKMINKMNYQAVGMDEVTLLQNGEEKKYCAPWDWALEASALSSKSRLIT